MPAIKDHRLSFVCVNDVYSFDNVDDNSDHPRGGWCRAASKIKQLVSQKKKKVNTTADQSATFNNSTTTVLSVVNGDVLGGSSLLVNCKGKVAIDVMNNINIDLAVLGNHEFDYGDEVLKQRLYESNFDWLGSNVYYLQQQQDDGDGSHNVRLQEKVEDEEDIYYFPNICGNGKLYTLTNNIKVGILGLVTKQTPKISCPSKDVTFDSDIIKVARRTANRLRKRGAQVLVAITHLSEVEDRLLAADTVVGVDLVLGGHEHEPLATMIHRNQQHEGEDSSGDDREVEVVKKHNEGGVLIFKCGMNAYWVGSVDLNITMASSEEDDTARVTSISTSWSMEAVNATVPEDPTTSNIVKRYRKETDESAMKIAFREEIASTISLDDVIANIGDNNSRLPLDTRMSSVRRREATGGNLVADAMHWVLQTSMSNANTNNYPMLAMINGGFIRGDRLYKPGSIFTVRDVLNELPFARTMKVLEIEGYHLKSAMAQQFMGSSRGPTGAYPHLSSNARLTYVLTTELDGSEDIGIQSFTVDDVEILDTQKYLIAVTCFVAGGNEGCTYWLESNCIQNPAWEDVNMSCILLKYLQSNSDIHPVLEDRVKKIN